MSIRLNSIAVDHAKELLYREKYVFDQPYAWTEYRSSEAEEDKFIQLYGFKQYSKWHLGIDDEQPEDSKERYKYRLGDFKKIHRCELLNAENLAFQHEYRDIEKAAHDLHGMIDIEERPLPHA